MTKVHDKLLDRLYYALPVELRHLPDRVRDVASQLGLRVAISGGLTRDLLRFGLGQINRDDFTAQLRDFDLVVQGSNLNGMSCGLAYAYELVRRLPGQLTVNEAFHTATIRTADGLELDIATARVEHYPSPGLLPAVDASGYSIEQDLPRRDFSINAVALELHPEAGQLIDPLGGAGDISDACLRILHSRSFVDDPTRLLRALRYSMRLNYDLEPVTRDQYQQAIDDGVLDCLSPERVRYELECIASEPRWVEVWGVMDLTRITDGLAEPLGGISRRWSLEDAQALDIALKNQHALLEQDQLDPWLMRTAWLLMPVPASQLAVVAERLGLFPKQIHLLLQSRALLEECAFLLAGELRPSQVVEILERWPRAAVATALFIYTSNVDSARMTRRQLLRYLDTWGSIRPELDGHALLSLGAPEGKALGRLSRHLRVLRLDGVVQTADEERAAALGWIARQTEPAEGEPGRSTTDDDPEDHREQDLA